MRDKQGQTFWAFWVHVMCWSWCAVPAKGNSTTKVLCLQQGQVSGMLLHSENYTRLSFQSLSKDETWMTEVEMFALPLLLNFNTDEGQCVTASSAGDLSSFSVHTSSWQEAAQCQSARHQFWCSIEKKKISEFKVSTMLLLSIAPSHCRLWVERTNVSLQKAVKSATNQTD